MVDLRDMLIRVTKSIFSKPGVLNKKTRSSPGVSLIKSGGKPGDLFRNTKKGLVPFSTINSTFSFQGTLVRFF